MATASSQTSSPEFLDEYNGDQLRSICIAFIIVNTFFVSTRFLARYYQKTPHGWDDLLVVVAWISLLALEIDSLLSLRWGVGWHIERVVALTPEKILHWGRSAFYAGPILYASSATWPKLSVVMLYLRIFTDKFSKYASWAIAAILVVSMIGNIFGTALQCFPVEKAWTPSLPGWCNNIQAHLIYGSIPNIFTDVAMLLLPIPAVWRLHAAKHVKFGLIATFFVGIIGLITSCLRLAEFWLNKYASDGTWFAAPLFIWSIVESSIYLMCACLLTFRPLVSKIIYSPAVSSFYSWLKRRTSYASMSDPSRDATMGIPSNTSKIRRQTTLDQNSESAEALAERGECYNMKAMPARDIRVQQDFSVESQKA